MALTSHHFRTTTGRVFRAYSEPVADHAEIVLDSNLWEEAFSDPTYTVPTEQNPGYLTLKDDTGTTWYLYAEEEATDHATLVVDSASPATAAGVFNEPVYETRSEQEGTTIHYFELVDEDGNEWFIYPNSNGEGIITATEPG